MTRDAYLKGLEEALKGSVPDSVVRENIDFYRDYINGELSKGKTVDDVVEEIGSPSLVARSIIKSGGGRRASGSSSSGNSNTSSSGNSSSQTTYEDTSGRSSYNNRNGGQANRANRMNRMNRGFRFGRGSRYMRLFMPLIIMIVLPIVMRLFSSVIFLVIRYAWPLLLIILIVWMIRRGSRRR